MGESLFLYQATLHDLSQRLESREPEDAARVMDHPRLHEDLDQLLGGTLPSGYPTLRRALRRLVGLKRLPIRLRNVVEVYAFHEFLAASFPRLDDDKALEGWNGIHRLAVEMSIAMGYDAFEWLLYRGLPVDVVILAMTDIGIPVPSLGYLSPEETAITRDRLRLVESTDPLLSDDIREELAEALPGVLQAFEAAADAETGIVSVSI